MKCHGNYIGSVPKAHSLKAKETQEYMKCFAMDIIWSIWVDYMCRYVDGFFLAWADAQNMHVFFAYETLGKKK